MTEKSKWTISEKERDILIDNLTKELPSLRAKADIPQDDLAKIIGVSRQTYGSIERRQRKMSWDTYLSLIFIFDFNSDTHDYLRSTAAYPCDIIKRINGRNQDPDFDMTKLTGFSADTLKNSLDINALHTIRTVILAEYARCSDLPDREILAAINDNSAAFEV